jgi:hypothetical protein
MRGDAECNIGLAFYFVREIHLTWRCKRFYSYNGIAII